MTDRVKYPHLMRLAEFHELDPHDDSLAYMADAVNLTRAAMSVGEEQAEAREDREEMLDRIEAVRDRLEQFIDRMHSPSKPSDGSEPAFEPADYAEAGFMLAGAVYQFIRRFHLEEAIEAYRYRKEFSAAGGSQTGVMDRRKFQAQYAPVVEEIRSYLCRNPDSTAAEIRRYVHDNAGKLGLDRNKIPKKSKFSELVKKEKSHSK